MTAMAQNSFTQATAHESLLWYGEGIPTLAPLGLAIPNPANRTHTQNAKIQQWVALTMQNLQSLMFGVDAMRTEAISVETATNIHRAVLTAINYLESRVKAPNEIRNEPSNANVAFVPWVFYPVPLYGQQVVNPKMKEYANLIMFALADAMQHADNGLSNTITDSFVNRVLPWLREVYTGLAVDFFNVPSATAKAAGFIITQQMVESYQPLQNLGQIVSPYTLPTNPSLIFTKTQLAPVTSGIPSTDLPANMRPWPASIPFPTMLSGPPLPASTQGSDQGSSGIGTAGSTGPVVGNTPVTMPAAGASPTA